MVTTGKVVRQPPFQLFPLHHCRRSYISPWAAPRSSTCSCRHQGASPIGPQLPLPLRRACQQNFAHTRLRLGRGSPAAPSAEALGLPPARQDSSVGQPHEWPESRLQTIQCQHVNMQASTWQVPVLATCPVMPADLITSKCGGMSCCQAPALTLPEYSSPGARDCETHERCCEGSLALNITALPVAKMGWWEGSSHACHC